VVNNPFPSSIQNSKSFLVDPTDEPAAELLKQILKKKAKLESGKKPHSKRFAKTEIVVA